MSQQQAKLDLEEIGERARHFVQGILDDIGVEAQTRVGNTEDLVSIDITGQDVGVILSDNARLLYALNHLVNQIFYRQSRNGCNFLLDCNNYRSDRTAELELMAEMGETVRALALAGLRQRHPDDSPAQRKRRLADLMLGPELAAQVYGPLPEEEE